MALQFCTELFRTYIACNDVGRIWVKRRNELRYYEPESTPVTGFIGCHFSVFLIMIRTYAALTAGGV